MKFIINIIGLPGSGKTTFADMLAGRLGAARVNADYVRTNINRDLGFSLADRNEQAHRIAHISNLVLSGSNQFVVTDFVNPTQSTREIFSREAKFPVRSVWMDTIIESRFEDTNHVFEKPELNGVMYKIEGWKTIDQLDDLAYQYSRAFSHEQNNSLRRYHIRFNTNCNKDPSIPFKWRVIDAQTNEERLAKSFHISGSHIMPGKSYDEFGVEKWNIEIRAALYWEGDHAYFVSN